MSVQTNALDDYNPFSKTDYGNVQPTRQDPTTHAPDAPKEMDPTITGISTTGPLERREQLSKLEMRQAELNARAEELDRREREYNARLQSRDTSSQDLPNWPPLPSWFPCRPCIRLDFESDIPASSRWLSRFGHYLWLFYNLVLIINVFGTLSYFIVGSTGREGPLFGVAIIVAIVILPASFWGWHQPLYKAFKKDSSFNFFLFFIVFFVQLIIIVIQCMGIDYLGSCGWINSLKTCGVNHGVCGFMLTIAILFSLATLAAIFLLIQVHRYYRSSGGSARRAKQEAETAILTNSPIGFSET